MSPLTHVYPHLTPGPPDLYSLLPSPVRVSRCHVVGITAIETIEETEEEMTEDGDSSKSPSPFHGFGEDLQPVSASSSKTSSTSHKSYFEMTEVNTVRSRSVTPPLVGYSSDLEPQTALVSTPVKGPRLPRFSPSDEMSRSPVNKCTATSNQPRKLHYQQLDPAAMFECTKCENMFVDYQDVLDHVDTFHPSLDTMSAIRRPEAMFLVSMECLMCRVRVVGSREQRLMLDHILVEHGDKMAERDNILWSCRMCDTQEEDEDTILKHVRERHEEKKFRAIDRPEENQPFIKRFKVEVEKRLRNIGSVSDKFNDTTLSEDEGDPNEDDLETEDKEREVEITVSRGQRLAVMKYNLEMLLKETKDLKRVLVTEENNNDV